MIQKFNENVVFYFGKDSVIIEIVLNPDEVDEGMTAITRTFNVSYRPKIQELHELLIGKRGNVWIYDDVLVFKDQGGLCVGLGSIRRGCGYRWTRNLHQEDYKQFVDLVGSLLI